MVKKGGVLDELPAELNEQAYMCQREQGVDGEDDIKTTVDKSGCALVGDLVQLRSSWVLWTGWGSHGSGRVMRRTLLRGCMEQQLLGEGHSSMRDDQKWQSRFAQAEEDGD